MFVNCCDLRIYKPDEFIVLHDLVWRLAIDGAEIGVTNPDLREITVPRGFITDFASIPVPFRNVFDINGPSRLPAVLHDWLYCSHRCARIEADNLFRFALATEGVGKVTRNIFYAGVRIGGWRYYGKRREGLHRDDFVPPGYWDAHP